VYLVSISGFVNQSEATRLQPQSLSFHLFVSLSYKNLIFYFRKDTTLYKKIKPFLINCLNRKQLLIIFSKKDIFTGAWGKLSDNFTGVWVKLSDIFTGVLKTFLSLQ